jgi:hypothetical protein
VRSRSPLQLGARRSVLLRGLAGAAICASAIAVAAVLVPLVSRWLDGPTRPEAPGAIVAVPSDIGPTLAPDTTSTRHKPHAKAKPHARHAVVVGGDVVILDGTDVAPKPAPAKTPEPAPAPAKHPASTAPAKTPTVVSDESKPAAPAVVPAPAPPPAAAASTGLVRLSVQSVGIGPNAAGDPELQAKLAIQGAQPTDALPDTVTLHLRPQMPSSAQSNASALALKATVDMVDAPRTAPTDPALRMRVRMAVSAAQAGTATAVPVVHDPGPADGKSNVIALTVGLQSFVRAPQDGTPGEGDPTTPPDNQGPGDGTTTPPPDGQGPGDGTTPPPDNQGPGDGTTTPPPDGQGPGDPTTPPGQPTGGDPATPPQPAPGDPTTPPDQPTGGGPTTTPPQPAPGDPTTTPSQPPAGGATTLPPTEILIPVGPVRPNGGTTTVPVPTDPTATDPPLDQLPIVVIVEELPPEPPPADPADQANPAVQDPAPEVVSPPADTTDPGTAPAPAPGPGVGDGTAIVVSADAPPADTSSS